MLILSGETLSGFHAFQGKYTSYILLYAEYEPFANDPNTIA